MNTMPKHSLGHVTLVGAGPGDPELLTLKAVKALQQAEVVLVDDLVHRSVLDWVPAHAKIIAVGKRGGCRSTPQAFINRLLLRYAKQGLRVVRLKGGDPFIFGRGGEEMLFLQNAGVSVHVVNGISSGLAAATAVGIPLTDRRCTHGVTLLTGHTGNGEDLPWPALVASGTTLVFYMGVSHAEHIAHSLMQAGMPALTPCAIIQQASLAQQRHALGVLQDLATLIQQHQLASPAIMVIGEVAALPSALVTGLTLAPEQAA